MLLKLKNIHYIS